MRVAPVQLAYLIFPGTSGARFLDGVVVDASVETDQWFGSAQATLKLVSLAQNEVFSARSWTGDHLCTKSRGLTDPSRQKSSKWTMLNVS